MSGITIRAGVQRTPLQVEGELKIAIRERLGTTEEREALLDRIDRITEIPLLLLAFAMVPLLAASMLWDLTPAAERTVLYLDIGVWALFAIDLCVKAVISPNKARFFRQRWLDVLIVVMPMFRPLRVVRAFLYGSRALAGVAKLVQVDYLVVYAVGLILVVSTVVTTAGARHRLPTGALRKHAVVGAHDRDDGGATATWCRPRPPAGPAAWC